MTLANNPPAVVMKAFTWAYEELGLTSSEAAQILGVSDIALRETALVGFEVASSESEVQIEFIKMYHLLYAKSDGSSDTMSGWFNSYNPHLDVVPKKACSNLPGIRYVSDYIQSQQNEPLAVTPVLAASRQQVPHEAKLETR